MKGTKSMKNTIYKSYCKKSNEKQNYRPVSLITDAKILTKILANQTQVYILHVQVRQGSKISSTFKKSIIFIYNINRKDKITGSLQQIQNNI